MYGQFFVLFAIVFTGYFLRKINFINDAMNNGLNRFIVYFAYPCVIVKNIGSLDMEGALLTKFFITALISLAMFAVYSAVALVYAKIRKFPVENSNVAELAMVSPNNGFMGFPVTQIFFGPTGFLMMIAHNASMNVFFFTYGLTLLRRNNEDRPKTSLKTVGEALFKLLINPNIVALFIGFAICLSGVKFEGSPVDSYVTYIGNVATPMAMIFIGSSLTKTNFKEIFADLKVVESSLMKLVILPVITFAIMYFLPVASIIKEIVVLGCCFPVAATVSMLAEQEGQDANISSRILMLSTVASIVTIPVAIKLITMFI